MTQPMTAHPPSTQWTLSLIVPVLNEAHSLRRFLDETLEVLLPVVPALEVIFIDDGSTDGTLEILRELSSTYPGARYVSFSRNFGKEAALSAGLQHATGDAVVPMDADLQHPPEAVIDFIDVWRHRGVEVVYGIPASKQAETASKTATSSWFYRLFNKISEVDIPASAGDFRLLDRVVVDTINRLPERNRFMKGIYAWAGFRSEAVIYQQRGRLTGTSRFNYWKLWNFALDGFIGFSTWPLRIWTYIGGIIALSAFVYMAIIITKTLIWGIDTPGYASLMSAVLFFGGMQLLSIGILGEYVARMFSETKRRPLYVVMETDST
ncbi:glycosyltransferase family 2 protein [Spiribacter roseus]|uniref:glycosyltransferase family 2 protein n=1 Tax=Spiribacter roseus TaxID=1855875 RepID=UPI0018E24BF5